MEFGILGPVAVRREGRDVPVGGPKQRALLAMLLLRANRPVSRDALIEGLWAERPPPSAAHTLDDYVSRLRKVLGPDRIERNPPGYLLRVHPGELDLDRFEQLLSEGRALLASGDPRGAATALQAALALWRGPALADVLFEPFAQVEAARLEERRLHAIDGTTEAELEQGVGAELVAELEGQVRESPLRERPVGHLMRALYRSGRQAEALAAYQTWRQRLAAELGLDPGPQLKELERRILAQDPSLMPADPPPSRQPAGARRRRRPFVLATMALIAGVGGAVTLALTGGAPRASSSAAQLVAVRTGSGSLAEALSLRAAPAALASLGASLWLAEPDVGEVARVDLRSGDVEERIPVGGAPGAIAAGGGSVWVASIPGRSVSRIDPATDAVTQTIALGGASIGALALGDGGLWLADTSDDSLLELNAVDGSVVRTIQLGFRPTALSVAGGTIWVADYDTATVAEIDPRSGQTEIQLGVGTGPEGLAFGDGSLWVANSLDSTVSRIDPARGSVVATIPVGSDPTSVVLAGGSVWTADQYSRELSRIDPRNYTVHAVKLAGEPTGLEAAGGRLWIGVRPTDANRGGTLILLHTRPITTDPALQLDLLPLQSDGFTRDNLVSYDHVGGPQGIALVPDLAIALPTPSANGRTYTFRLRPGIRYSDGRLVHARDFRRALVRVFRLRSPGASLFAGLVGGRACLARPATCDLSRGIVTNDVSGSVSFHLAAPDADFLVKLTYGALSSPVPGRTPLHAGQFPRIPGTGPYEIARANRQEIVYVRNPYFREWSHAAQPEGNPDRIVMRFGLSAAQETRAIEEGRADWMAEQVPGRLLGEVGVRFPSQLHSFSNTETDFLQLDTIVPPFDDVRVRRALEFALDRRVVVRAYGGTEGASAACQVLPPGLSGYRPYCPYTERPNDGLWHAPDLARAKRLVAGSGARGKAITVWGASDDPTISPSVIEYIAAVLRKLGFRAQARLEPSSYFAQHPGAFSTIQAISSSWLDTSAFNFFEPWLSCKGEFDHGWYCSPRLDGEITAAEALDATNPEAAENDWARIDRQLTDAAVWIPFANPRQIDFVSSRVHGYQHNPYWDIVADQLWIGSARH